MKKTVLILACIATVFGCNQRETKEAETAESIQTETTASISEENKEVLDAYLELKDHLVETDFENAQSSAERLAAAIKNAGLDDEMVSFSEKMASSENIEGIRENFSPMSQVMYDWLKRTEKGNIAVFWQYCPMAKDNQGANWLSLEREIMNPYFGDMMLHCGNVEEEF